MEHPEVKGPTRILVNDKDVSNEGGLPKARKWLKELVKNVFLQEDTEDAFPFNNKALRNTFWTSQLMCTRIILLSCFFSFVVAWQQNIPLIGEDGLTPAKEHVNKMMKDLHDEGIWEKFRTFHSLFWFLPASDLVLTVLPIVGMVLSLVALLLNQINIVTVLPIYVILQSIYSVGNVWYNYVFEIELLELVFLSLLLVPLCRNHLKCRFSSTPFVRYVCRFFVFKVLLGSSLIRFRNTDSWGNLEGKYYLYETQPLPSSIGYIFHGSFTMSKLDNLFCILTECVFSFFILFPVRSFRLIGGVLILLYCVLNFVTGNSYLFYVLLVAPLMFCFDDEVLLPFVLKSRRNEVLSVVREKATQLSKSRGYFQSFDVLYCTGFSVDEVNKMKDAYFRIDSEEGAYNGDDKEGSAWNGGNHWNGWNNTRGISSQPEKEHLLSRATSNQETNFYPEENHMECIKKDVLNAFHWIFSKKGPQYILNNYNTSRELIVHVVCVLIMLTYNSFCVYLTYFTRESIFLFFVYVSIFLVYMVYLFFFTKNVFPCLVSQVGLLFTVSLIYTNYIFQHGFSDVYFSSLFFLHLFCLLSLSVFHLSNQRFVVKCLSQYFYFVLFLYFLCFFVQNALSPLQVMNAEYGNFQQMNVYGSFGHINKVRREIIITASNPSNGSSIATSGGKLHSGWDNYEFNCKPDNVEKTLCSQFRLVYGFLPVLYVDRLDWQFNQLSYSDDQTILHTSWFQRFLNKLASNDEGVLSLLYRTPSFVNPPPGKNPSKSGTIHLTVSSDVYRFSPQGEKNAWWEVVSSRVILEQKGLQASNGGFITIGTHNGVNPPDERNNLLRVGYSPGIQRSGRSTYQGNHYGSTVEDTSGETMSGKIISQHNMRKKKHRVAEQGKLHVEEPETTEKESLPRKIRTQEKNRYAQKKKNFFRQKKLQELKTEGEEKDSMEEAQMMKGSEQSGREHEGETPPQLEDGMAIDDADKAIDGENLFSAVQKMEAEREKASRKAAQKRKYKMAVGVTEKKSPNGVLPSIISLNGVFPSMMSPKGVLSLDKAIQKEMDEAIRNSYRQYGLLNDFSRKITKLGFVNIDEGRSRYGEIKELLAKSQEEDTHKGT
ncbi:Integral membrane protein [Plasmodium coatneyi]|uniref:Integral membrane protein n=1 Tax=Plasmodium coatneyi TaxID=208452 RepID=A0A1B1E247_9APIC|nr:Integral membrane protein [Plasmodium coatneyi]ANQ09101.1 Integral membrane protein [Plasmodium coatneyi]